MSRWPTRVIAAYWLLGVALVATQHGFRDAVWVVTLSFIAFRWGRAVKGDQGRQRAALPRWVRYLL